MFPTVSPDPIAPRASRQSRRLAPGSALATEAGQDPIAGWRSEILDFLRRHGPTYREWIPARWPVTRLVRDRLVEDLVREGAIELAGGRVRAVEPGRLSAP